MKATKNDAVLIKDYIFGLNFHALETPSEGLLMTQINYLVSFLEDDEIVEAAAYSFVDYPGHILCANTLVFLTTKRIIFGFKHKDTFKTFQEISWNKVSLGLPDFKDRRITFKTEDGILTFAVLEDDWISYNLSSKYFVCGTNYYFQLKGMELKVRSMLPFAQKPEDIESCKSILESFAKSFARKNDGNKAYQFLMNNVINKKIQNDMVEVVLPKGWKEGVVGMLGVSEDTEVPGYCDL